MSPRCASALARYSVPARRRRLNDDRLAGFDHGGIGAFEPLLPAIVAPHPVLADLTILAARKTERVAPGSAAFEAL